MSIPYSRKLSREKTFAKIGGNTIFVESTFADCLLVLPMNVTPPNFAKKTYKPRNLLSFLPQKFSSVW